jgi:hypothetical protein
VLYEIVRTADVFLVSRLPITRRAFGIDVDQTFEQNSQIVYALGTGQGTIGPEASRGGYDGITFGNRGGIASSVTPPDRQWPLGMPVGAFGDTLSGLALAGGVAAALAAKARTGRGSVVDGSLLATSWWAMAPGIAASAIAGGDVTGRTVGRNPLSATYRTADDRFVVLRMAAPADAPGRPMGCRAAAERTRGGPPGAGERLRANGRRGPEWFAPGGTCTRPPRRPTRPCACGPRRGEHTRSVLESLRLSEPLLARASAEGAVRLDDSG